MQAASVPVQHTKINNVSLNKRVSKIRRNGQLQSNSTSTLYVNNTISCPDVDELLYW